MPRSRRRRPIWRRAFRAAVRTCGRRSRWVQRGDHGVGDLLARQRRTRCAPSRRPTMRRKVGARHVHLVQAADQGGVALRRLPGCSVASVCCAQGRVERGQRLVDQQDFGIGQQQARQAAALAFAAGQAVDARIQFVAQVEARQRLAARRRGSAGATSERSACHKLQCGRRAASTAVTTRWRGGSGGVCGARNRRARRRWRAALRQRPRILAQDVAARPRSGGGRRPGSRAGWSCRRPDGPIRASCSPWRRSRRSSACRAGAPAACQVAHGHVASSRNGLHASLAALTSAGRRSAPPLRSRL